MIICCLAAIPWAFSQDTQSSWGFSRLITWYVCNNWACVVPVLIMFKLHLLYGLTTSGSECATPLTTSGSRLWFALYVPRPAVTHIKHGRARCPQQCKHSCTASHLHMNSCLAAHNQRTHRMQRGVIDILWQKMFGELKGQFNPKSKGFIFIFYFFCLFLDDMLRDI